MHRHTHKTIRIKDGSVDLVADINAAVTVNTNEGGQVTHTSSRSEAAVVQRKFDAQPQAPETEPPAPDRG